MSSGQAYGGMKGKLAQSVDENVGGMRHDLKAMAGGVLPKVTKLQPPGKINTSLGKSNGLRKR